MSPEVESGWPAQGPTAQVRIPALLRSSCLSGAKENTRKRVILVPASKDAVRSLWPAHKAESERTSKDTSPSTAPGAISQSQ